MFGGQAIECESARRNRILQAAIVAGHIFLRVNMRSSIESCARE